MPPFEVWILCVVLFAAIMLGCTGCGRPIPELRPEYHCTVGGTEVSTEGPLLATRVEANVRLAHELLLSHKIVGEREAALLFEGLKVEVSNEGCLNPDSEQTQECVMGRSHFHGDKVIVNITMYGLLHEMLHQVDNLNFFPAFTSGAHWTWDDKRRAAEAEWDTRYERTFTIKNGATWAACGGPPKN